MNVHELFARVRLPFESEMLGFDGATTWLNSEPLTRADLSGKVVAVDFWTYTCINWLRTLPYLRAWASTYSESGLVVVGVHTPEFGVEHDVNNVRRAVRDMGIEYPVAIDNNYAVWNAFANQYWPALYIADAEGRIRHHQFGEGDYKKSELAIRHLMADAGVDDLPKDPNRSTSAASNNRRTGTPCDPAKPMSAMHAPKASALLKASHSTSRRCTPCRLACTSTSGRFPATGRSGAKRR